ncbi:MAG: hypothetical protein V1914_02940 [archaeon]
MNKEFCSWGKFEEGIEVILSRLKEIPGYVIAIPRGGLVLGVRLSHELDKPLAVYGTDSMNKYNPEKLGLLVDDLSDTGKVFLAILDSLRNRNLKTVALYKKPGTLYIPDYYVFETSAWIVFPWERKSKDSVDAGWKF